MKKVLILVVSCDFRPFDKMIQTSLNTWDRNDVEGVETLFYCGKSIKQNTNKIVYLPVVDSYATMGEKMLQAFEIAINNKEFDYIARVNSSTYVDKKQLIKHVQTLPDNKLFQGLEVKDTRNWVWGGGSFILSKDVVKKIVDNRNMWDHRFIEDKALSFICDDLGFKVLQGKACSIDKRDEGWGCISYGTESIEFTDFADVKKLGHHFYRVKQDYDRSIDKYIMDQLFMNL